MGPVRVTNTGSKGEAARAGEGSGCFMGTGFQFYKMKTFWRLLAQQQFKCV